MLPLSLVQRLFPSTVLLSPCAHKLCRGLSTTKNCGLKQCKLKALSSLEDNTEWRMDRDTQKFACKCSYAEIGNKGIDVQKQPVEIDHHGVLRQSFKKSKAGRLKLIQTVEGGKTVKENEMPKYWTDW
jgi:hypothetical protein